MRRLISAVACRRVRWNNGGGTTDDIDVVDAAGQMVWRLWVAAIERSGPFSDFSGYDRTIVALSGDAFSLDVSGAAAGRYPVEKRKQRPCVAAVAVSRQWT